MDDIVVRLKIQLTENQRKAIMWEEKQNPARAASPEMCLDYLMKKVACTLNDVRLRWKMYATHKHVDSPKH